MEWLQSAIGGILIGLSASILWLGFGRIAGVSGILKQAIAKDVSLKERSWRSSFIAGPLLCGAVASYARPEAIGESPVGVGGLALAGLLVGFGTALGGGCTSGHGVCGMARLSKRSIVATLTFMISAGVVVWFIRHSGVL